MKISPDHNLAVKHPELAKEWYPTKNGNSTPAQVTPGSGKKVLWICIREHDWEATLYNRTSGTGCPDFHREHTRTTKFEYGNLFSSMYQINDLGHGFFGTKYSNIFTNSTEIYALMA